MWWTLLSGLAIMRVTSDLSGAVVIFDGSLVAAVTVEPRDSIAAILAKARWPMPTDQALVNVTTSEHARREWALSGPR